MQRGENNQCSKSLMRELWGVWDAEKLTVGRMKNIFYNKQKQKKKKEVQIEVIFV